jgi:hypothetical protein
MDKVQRIDRRKTAQSSKTFRDEVISVFLKKKKISQSPSFVGQIKPVKLLKE